MLNLVQILADELSIAPWQVQNTLNLFTEGGTVPFIARYRKERTGGLDETVIRLLEERNRYFTELEERKQTILESIEEQGKLTEELNAQITRCIQKTELEDLYLPYKPKRRTRATIAREKGLEPLALWIKSLNTPEAALPVALADEASRYVSAELQVNSANEALLGAGDIIAEEVSETAELRSILREFLTEQGVFVARIKEEHPAGTTQFENYRDYRVSVKDIAPHSMLALRRGESEGILTIAIEFDEQITLEKIRGFIVQSYDQQLIDFYTEVIADAFKRLLKPGLVGEIRLIKKENADEASIRTFAANLRELLLSSPAGMRPTLGIDPGFRTGCKVAALDHTGKFLEYRTVFPHTSKHQRPEAAATILEMVQKYRIELIAIGNGTAGRETMQFVQEILKSVDHPPITVTVSEAGASVYSASPVAIEEFPSLDVTARGAISIGRRIQDPLAELVKIDPKSIGVGQYQHDVDQSLLKRKLEETVESCVNYVGVDLNTASKELLQYVAGLTSGVAKNIVDFRNDRGPFNDRLELLGVPRLGPKAFEQAAGFLRIRAGKNPLDNTAVHPESYPVVTRIASDLDVPLDRITQVPELLDRVDLKQYVTYEIGEPTLRDILAELRKPGRDPRAEFRYAQFREDVMEIKDLKPGMILEGVVTNVADFGAFVDIGVHRDGLVHVSQLSNQYVKDPRQVVKVGQVVKVRILEVNAQLNRINLSMRLEDRPTGKPNPRPQPSRKEPEKKQQIEKGRYTLDDLKQKFSKNR